VAISLSLSQRAVEIDRDDPLALALFGWFRILFLHDFSATQFVDRAVKLNPNCVPVLMIAATTYLYADEPENVVSAAMKVLQLSPGAPENYASITHVAQGWLNQMKFEQAADWAQKAVDANSDYAHAHLALCCALFHLGRVDEGKASVAVAMALDPSLSIRGFEQEPVRYPERRGMWSGTLRALGYREG
jgi:tetratricopeptide (TPR) repeat protein